jgi:hypothetical protein
MKLRLTDFDAASYFVLRVLRARQGASFLSALGQKATSRDVRTMSALLPKADMRGQSANVLPLLAHPSQTGGVTLNSIC